ncbi:hypothetical protein [Aeromonas allosaccharophila]|uniref:hypothetical protein n=1 Tax=Aeromonas allosaccharophila TaxID=656 RepID=UPI00341B5443
MQNIKTPQQDGSGPHRQGNSRTNAKRETVKRPQYMQRDNLQKMNLNNKKHADLA